MLYILIYTLNNIIYILQLLVYREREREKRETYTHILKISKYMEQPINIYIHAENFIVSVHFWT